MRYIILLILSVLFCARGFAQSEIRSAYVSEDENKLIKDDDSVKYYTAAGDTDNVVAIYDDAQIYKLYNKDKKLIAEGSFNNDGDKFMRVGRWTEYYDNGKPKISGNFYRNHPVGLWQEYYPNGKYKAQYNYAIMSNKGSYKYCLSGFYNEYYENGRLKVCGYYNADMENYQIDTISTVDPVTNQNTTKLEKVSMPKPEKFGTWEYYDENGELANKEEH